MVMWEWDKIRELQMCSGLGTCTFPGFLEHLEQEQGEVQAQLYKNREVEEGLKETPEKRYLKVKAKLVFIHVHQLVFKLERRIPEEEMLE